MRAARHMSFVIFKNFEKVHNISIKRETSKPEQLPLDVERFDLLVPVNTRCTESLYRNVDIISGQT
jgi:hypothetical protein